MCGVVEKKICSTVHRDTSSKARRHDSWLRILSHLAESTGSQAINILTCSCTFIYVCVCTYTCIYKHIYRWMYIHICIHMYIYTYRYIHICLYTCIYVCAYIYTYAYMHMYTYIYTHIHTYVYMHIYTYTYIQIHIHISSSVCKRVRGWRQSWQQSPTTFTQALKRLDVTPPLRSMWCHSTNDLSGHYVITFISVSSNNSNLVYRHKSRSHVVHMNSSRHKLHTHEFWVLLPCLILVYVCSALDRLDLRLGSRKPGGILAVADAGIRVGVTERRVASLICGMPV